MPMDPSTLNPSVQWPTSPEANGIISPLVSGNYVTPEQAKSMREYADALRSNAMKMPVKNGWQGLAQMANALMGGAMSNYADKQGRDIVNQGLSASQPLANTLDAVNGGGSASTGTPPPPTNTHPQPSVAQESPPTDTPVNSDSRGMRNNNPGNLESNRWTASLPGYKGTDGRFAIFDSLDHGQGALDRNLQGYGKKGLETPLAIASTWAPGSEKGNNPNSYGSVIAKTLGVGLNDKIDMSDPSVRAKIGQAIALVENGPGKTHMGATAHPNPTQTDNPTGAAYAPNGTPPAVAAINNSAPVAPSNPIAASAAPGGPNPYQIAALRGGAPTLNGHSAVRMMGDPSVPDKMKDMAQSLVAPQTIQGPFGTSYLTSMAGALNGSTPRQYMNTGQMLPTKIGPVETNNYLHVGPDGKVSSTLITPGSTVDLNGKSPTPSSGNSVTTPTPPASSDNGEYIPPMPKTGNIDDYVNWGSAVDAGKAAQVEDYKKASEAADASRKTVPAIQNSLNNLNQVKGYMDALSKTKDPNTVFGPLEKRSEEVMGILNQLGIGGKDLRDTLGNLQGVNKGLNQLIASQSQALEGNNGKALASGIELATQASPNQSLSYQGIVKTMNSLQKIMDYRQNYELAKQDWVGQHHNLTGFDREWTKGVQGQPSQIATAKPYVLSDTPMEPPKILPDGSKIIKVPSTEIQKNGQGYRLIHVPKDAE